MGFFLRLNSLLTFSMTLMARRERISKEAALCAVGITEKEEKKQFASSKVSGGARKNESPCSLSWYLEGWTLKGS